MYLIFSLARNIFRVLFRRQLPERNELFLPRRMAYLVDLEDEFAESDIPTTIVRSKADCPSLEVTIHLIAFTSQFYVLELINVWVRVDLRKFELFT